MIDGWEQFTKEGIWDKGRIDLTRGETGEYLCGFHQSASLRLVETLGSFGVRDMACFRVLEFRQIFPENQLYTANWAIAVLRDNNFRDVLF